MEKLAEAQQDAVKALVRGQAVMASIGKSRLVGGGSVARFKAVPDGVRHMAGAIADPAKFWGLAATGSLGGGGAAGEQASELAASAIQIAAAKMKVGDFGPVRESLLGQAMWLNATAVRLMALTADVPDGPAADEKRAELVRLSLRASDQAVKVLASAAALNAIGGGGVTVVG